MPTYRFPINGLRHHDFKGRLDELYKLALGRRMSISIEHDNPGETDAVIVYWGKRFVGYVRSGEDREKAAMLIEQTGRGSLLGKIVDVDREKRWLWMEITSEQELSQTVETRPNLLTNWTFDGKTLPSDEEEVRLHTMLCNLEMVIEGQEPWDEDMEEWLEYAEQNLWRDISFETSELLKHILTLLTACDDAAYRTAASRLQFTIDFMGSPEVRRLQAQQIIDKAHAGSMDTLLLHYAESAKKEIRKLPEELLTLFLKDGEVFMGRMWYLHRPYKQMQAIKTLLAMMVRLKDDAGEEASQSISKEWLIRWGASQQDKRKAEVVQEIISTFELQRTNPILAQQMAGMLEYCNCQKQANEALKNVAGAIRENPPVNAGNYYASGSTHEDKGKHLYIGTDNKETLGMIEHEI